MTAAPSPTCTQPVPPMIPSPAHAVGAASEPAAPPAPFVADAGDEQVSAGEVTPCTGCTQPVPPCWVCLDPADADGRLCLKCEKAHDDAREECA